MLGKEARTPVLPLSGSSGTYAELNDASEMNITCILAITDTWRAMEGNEVCHALCHCVLGFVMEIFKLKEAWPWNLSDLKINARSSVWFWNVTHLALSSPQPCLLISPPSSLLPFSVISDLFPPNLASLSLPPPSSMRCSFGLGRPSCFPTGVTPTRPSTPGDPFLHVHTWASTPHWLCFLAQPPLPKGEFPGGSFQCPVQSKEGQNTYFSSKWIHE